MRTTWILALMALMPLMALAQNNEGSIVFTTKMKVKLEGDIVNMLSKEQLDKIQNRVEHNELLFNSRESVYKKYDATKNDKESSNQEFSSGDQVVKIQFVGGGANDDQLYYGIADQQVVDMRTFMGRTFLIRDKSTPLTWKLTNETKTIEGYECKKAMAENENAAIEAWFTMQIPVASGPKGYGQLPGMILELKTTPREKDGKAGTASVTTATKVEFKKLEKDVIVPPKKGKKVTKKQFEKIVKEKLEEMQEMYKDKGGSIKIERH